MLAPAFTVVFFFFCSDHPHTQKNTTLTVKSGLAGLVRCILPLYTTS